MLQVTFQIKQDVGTHIAPTPGGKYAVYILINERIIDNPDYNPEEKESAKHLYMYDNNQFVVSDDEIDLIDVESHPEKYIDYRVGDKSPADHYIAITEEHMEKTVQEHGYDSVLSAISYVGCSDKQWSAEGKLVRDWRAKVYRKCFDLIDDIDKGTINPTDQEFINLLPQIQW